MTLRERFSRAWRDGVARLRPLGATIASRAAARLDRAWRGAIASLGAVVIALLAVIAYVDATRGAFHFDDSHAVEENPAIRSLANVGRFFVDPTAFSVLPQNTGYRPVLLVSFALNAQIGGVSPAAFLAGNLLVHLLCALLLHALIKGLARRLGRPDAGALAFVAAAIFAVHPLFSECVNYVSARSESLSSTLGVAALLAWLRGREDRRWLAAAAISLLAAMLTKPVVITLPVFAGLILWAIPGERSARPARTVERLAWLAVPAAAGAALVLYMTPPIAIASASGFDRWTYLRSQLPATLHYLRLFVWPVGQSADADYPAMTSFAQPEVWLSALVLLTVAGWTVWALATRRRPGVALAVCWFFLCLAVTALFPLAEIVNEHRPYLAAASLCVLAAHALRRLPTLLFGTPAATAGPPAHDPAIITSAADEPAPSVVSPSEISDYGVSATASPTASPSVVSASPTDSSDVSGSPEVAPRAPVWAALVPSVEARIAFARSLAAVRAATPAVVAVAAVLAVLGTLTVSRNRVWENPATLWQDVVAKAPLSPRAHMNYGLALMNRGNRQAAEAHLREAVRLSPTYSYARINLGSWLMAGGSLKEAAAELDLAIALDPQLFYGHYFRGRVATLLSEPPSERARHLGAAVALSPSYADAWYQLALARDAAGDHPGTIEAAARAAALRGTYEDRFLHGYALLQARQVTAAMAVLNALARERPDDHRVSYNLSYAARLLAP